LRHVYPLFLSSLFGCASNTDGAVDTGDTDADADTDADTDTDTDTDADTDTASDVRTLDNCGGSFTDSVPAFFSRYFRCATLSTDANNVLVGTTDLPPHLTYYYGEDSPNYVAWDDRGGDYHPNPNTLGAQNIILHIPTNPVAKGLTITSDLVDLEADTSDDEYNLGPAGVALDSVLYFNATAAPGDDILDEQWTFDTYSAHPAGTEYHYHADTPGPLEALASEGIIDTTVPGAAAIELFGIMCDGTVLLGCTELDGSAPDTADFDAQNGHVGDLVDEEGTTHFTNRYHVHLCPAFGHYGLAPEIQYYSTCDVQR
jgi:hypothetical protein